mgnify:CR=1 FL=1
MPVMALSAQCVRELARQVIYACACVHMRQRRRSCVSTWIFTGRRLLGQRRRSVGEPSQCPHRRAKGVRCSRARWNAECSVTDDCMCTGCCSRRWHAARPGKRLPGTSRFASCLRPRRLHWISAGATSLTQTFLGAFLHTVVPAFLCRFRALLWLPAHFRPISSTVFARRSSHRCRSRGHARLRP